MLVIVFTNSASDMQLVCNETPASDPVILVSPHIPYPTQSMARHVPPVMYHQKQSEQTNKQTN